MECTVDNFEEIFKRLQQEIPTASFISIDGEFTGLQQSDEHSANEIDVLEERYQKVKVSAQNFDWVQFGVCLFHQEEEEEEEVQEDEGDEGSAMQAQKQRSVLIARPYNFYLFKRGDTKHTFVSQASSISFLMDNNMDFNKVFKKGISYCNEQELTRYETFQRELEEKRKKQAALNVNKIDVSMLSARDTTMLKSAMDKVREWLDHTDEAVLDSFHPSCNSYQRRVLYQEIGGAFDGRVSMKSVKTNGGIFIQLKRIESAEQQHQIEEERRRELQKKIDDYAGFRRVVELLLQHKKPLVGHNCMLDLAHLFDKCVEPLPSEPANFKTAIHEVFPYIMDTKYMATRYAQLKEIFERDTHLELLFKATNPEFAEAFKNSLVIRLGEGFEIVEESAAHDAAYDAYMTGVIFARMSHFIGTNRSKLYDGHSVASQDHMKELVNRVFLFASDGHFDITDSDDIKQDRSNVFLVTNLSEKMTDRDLHSIFEAYGKIRIVWVSSDCCFVRIRDKSQVEKAKQELVKRADLGCVIMTYEQAQEGGILKHLQSRYQTTLPRSCKRARLTDSPGREDSGPGNKCALM